MATERNQVHLKLWLLFAKSIELSTSQVARIGPLWPVCPIGGVRCVLMPIMRARSLEFCGGSSKCDRGDEDCVRKNWFKSLNAGKMHKVESSTVYLSSNLAR